MHEVRIAADLGSIVIQTAVREELSRVTRVNVNFGQLVQIVPEIFEFAFSEAVKGTLAQDALLDIEIIPVKMVCKTCGTEFNVMDNVFRCRKCNSTDLEIKNGKELFVKSIEGER